MKGVKQLGFRTGNWLSAEESSEGWRRRPQERATLIFCLMHFKVLATIRSVSHLVLTGISAPFSILSKTESDRSGL